MRWYRSSAGSACLAVLLSAPVSAQDAVKVDPQHYKVILDNASVRVIRVSYSPGAKSVMHSHPESIFISLSPSKARFTMPDGKAQDMDMAADSAMYLPAATHNPSNIGSTPVDGILIEFKAPAPGKAAVPTSRPEMTMKLLAEGPRAAAYRVTATSSFSEPAGSKHDFDQVVVALGPLPVSLSIEGKPAKTSWARGEAVFIGRGTAHESKNTGGKAAESVIVFIK
jgi:quercetin dioxygenase-like cupin family protein